MSCLDQFFDRRMTSTYNCFDHVREVWEYLEHADIRLLLPKLQGTFQGRAVGLNGARTFQRVSDPKADQNYIVLMQKALTMPHVGVWHQGQVIHLHAGGVEYQPVGIAARRFERVRFYR